MAILWYFWGLFPGVTSQVCTEEQFAGMRRVDSLSSNIFGVELLLSPWQMLMCLLDSSKHQKAILLPASFIAAQLTLEFAMLALDLANTLTIVLRLSVV